MNPRTTYWLVGTALLLAAFILLFERRAPSTAQRRAEAARLLPGWEPRRVVSLEIRAGTNRPVVLERGTNTWFFRAPLLYPARADLVEQFLTLLAGLSYVSRVSAEEVLRQTNGLAAFGLTPPAVTVSLNGEQDERFTLLIGRPLAVGRQLFVQVVGRDGIFAVDAGVAGWLPASFEAWRDTGLINVAGLPFNRLEVRPLTNGFEALRDPASREWTLTKPLPTRANRALLDHLLRELDLLRVARFVADPPGLDPARYGLAPPQRELVFAQGTNELLRLQLGLPSPDQPDFLHARVMHLSNVVLVPAAPLQTWFTGFTNFCDRRLLIFDSEQVTRIEVRVDEPFALERETNHTWRIVEPYSARADPALVAEALEEMAALEFLGFEREVATDFAPYGLDPPRRQYLLKGRPATADGTNVVLAQVDYGNPTGHRYYARRSLEPSVLLALDPVRLPRAAYRLRDRQIWNVNTNDLLAITVRQGDRERKLVRTGPMQWVAAEGSGPPPNSWTLEEAAFRLGLLRAERWVAQGEDRLAGYGIVTGAHEVILETRGAAPPVPYRVRFGRRAASGRTYAAVTLPEPPGTVVFECPRAIYDFVLSDLTLPETPPAETPAP